MVQQKRLVVRYKGSMFDALAATCKALSLVGRRYDANELTRRIFQLDPNATQEALAIIREYVELFEEPV